MDRAKTRVGIVTYCRSPTGCPLYLNLIAAPQGSVQATGSKYRWYLLLRGLMLLADAECIPVSFSGNVTISNIESAQGDLGVVLQQDGPVVMDISGVTETDLTFIQLIESARRKAAETGRDFMLRHPADGAVLEVLRRGGFLDDDNSDRATFWLQEAAQ